MKLSKIAIASLLAVGSASSFAQTTPVANPCASTDNVTFAKGCVPYATFYIAGSSALGGGIKKIIQNGNYFDESVRGYFEVVDTGTDNGISIPNPKNEPTTKAGQGVTAWYGMSNPDLTGGSSKPIFIVYNSFNGSAAGVSQVIASKFQTISEAKVVRVGPDLKAKTQANCVAYNTQLQPAGESSTTKGPAVDAARPKVACESFAITKADIAITDVDIPELAALYSEAEKSTLTAFTRQPLAMQGFAVAVNNNFYNALQAKQVTDGLLAADCTTGNKYTWACQPSISKAQYASLISQEGSIKSAADFGVTSGPLTIARRDSLSGTQASSNIFFLNNSCNKIDAKNARGGALTPLTKTSTVPSGLTVLEYAQSSGVDTALGNNSAGTYAIGVIALAKGASTTYKFVKIDGASPNFAPGATTTLVAGTSSGGASTLRNNMLNGSWAFQMTAFAVYNTKSADESITKNVKAKLINKMVADLSDPALHDLDAIGYFSGDLGIKQTYVSRAANLATAKQLKDTPTASNVLPSNCAPLIHQDNAVNIGS